MADKLWKKFERRAARFFGAERNPLSGGNARHSRSDSLHDTLYIECKYSKRHAIVNLWDKSKPLADKEKKIPVVVLGVRGRHGFWVMCHSDDLTAVANQRALAAREGDG